ncbi:MAG: fumarate hydratase C-terminal domain-containing protein [Oscillospiraceae bacterium]|nr:fumarate hydratase C-terminal domain-containing protein [Oscillospiraceae bacterium]
MDYNELREKAPHLKPGDRVFFTGTIYTARDQAHMRLMELLERGEALPFPLEGSIIYYAGPTPGRGDRPTLACGPTTSSRMDKFAPELYDRGVFATIGKGPRSDEVNEAIAGNGALYLCATGGAGALIAKCVEKMEIIAFPDLGCEAIRRVEVKDLPLIVGTDTTGSTLFK